MKKMDQLSNRYRLSLRGSVGFGDDRVKDITFHLNLLLGAVRALHAKTTGFREHLAKRYFYDCGRLLQEQADQIFAMAHGVVERICNLRDLQLIPREEVSEGCNRLPNTLNPQERTEMLRELREDNAALMKHMLEIHDLCDDTNDLETAGSLEIWIDEAHRRIWFLGSPSLNRDGWVTE